MNAIACVWRSKDQLWAVVSGSKHLCLLNHLSDSNLLMSALIGMNFPQRAAFTVSYRFCYVVSLFSFNSGISSFSGVLFDPHEFVGLCFPPSFTCCRFRG